MADSEATACARSTAAIGGTTTGGTRMTNAPPLKEDIIWTSMLQSPQTSTLPLAEDNSTPKPRKQNL